MKTSGIQASRKVGSTSRSRSVRWFVAVVAGCAGIVAAGLAGQPFPDDPTWVLCLGGIGLLAGATSVRFPKLGTSFAPTEPFVLVGLCVAGPWAAVAVAVAAVPGRLMIGRMRPLQFAFNVFASLASAGGAALAFLGSGGLPGAEPSTQMLPLLIAAAVFLLLNGSLVAAVVALAENRSLVATLKSVLLRLAPASAVAPALALALVFTFDGALLWAGALAAFGFAATLLLFAIGAPGSSSRAKVR